MKKGRYSVLKTKKKIEKEEIKEEVCEEGRGSKEGKKN